jgi:hypothetical protein
VHASALNATLVSGCDEVEYGKLAALLPAALILLGAACGSGGNSGGAASGDPTAAITARMNSLLSHINSGDAKAILDNDVPPSARRTCSDQDAKNTIDALRQSLPAGATLSLSGVSDVNVVGNRATATVMIDESGQQPQPASLVFVKSGNSWKLDTSGQSGCAGLIPH